MMGMFTLLRFVTPAVSRSIPPAIVIVLWSLPVAAAPLEVKQSDGAVSVVSEGRPVFVYLSDKVPFKPYVQQFFSPGGFNVLRDNVPDHVHHHGLMFALGVNGVSFWAEAPDSGHEVHKSIEVLPSSTKDGIQRAGFSGQVEWQDPKGAVLLNEQRTVLALQVGKAEPPVSFLTWESRLLAPPGKESVELSGSHYYGLGLRFPQSMDAIGTFFNASGNPGEVVRGDERNLPAAWCAYTAAPEGKSVTLAAFGHPDNVRGPATWFTMANPFAYMSATLNLHKEPLKLTADKPLVLRYAVAVWDGKIEASQIDMLYQVWLTLSK